MIPANERLCWFCKHFSFDPGSQGYSDLTPGYDARVECLKDVWQWNIHDEWQPGFGKDFMVARKCEHYEELKDLSVYTE